MKKNPLSLAFGGFLAMAAGIGIGRFVYTPILPPMLPVYEEKLYSVYSEVSGKPRGQGVGVLRDVIICDTDEEAKALWRDSGQFSGRAWFEPFGFRRGMMDPKTGASPTSDEIIEMGYAYVGTVDTVLRAMETQQKRQPVDWVFCYTYNSLVPHPVLMSRSGTPAALGCLPCAARRSTTIEPHDRTPSHRTALPCPGSTGAARPEAGAR